MAEIRRVDFNKIECRCKKEGKDFIPSNWYIPARKAWSVFAWVIVQIRNGSTIRSNDDVDKFIHKYWEYIEEYAVAVGEEKKDEENNS